MLYEIHMLKNYPPVNLNRDDTGSPKTCFFGGVQRGRISSQCLKYSWRTSDLYPSFLEKSGIRTRGLPQLLREELESRGYESDFIESACKKATGLPNKDGKETTDGKTTQIIFYSAQDINAVADRMIEELEKAGSVKAFDKLKAKDIATAFSDVKTRPVTLDIAMFGRMVTSFAFRDVDAAVQVSHAISTHAVNQESDYFIAADDLLNEDDTGAAMIGDIDYNSCCFYFYVAVDTDILSENLKDSPDSAKLIDEVIPALVKLMAFTNPGGKQNSFAGHILPSLVCVEKKDCKIPVSLANAFAKPVNPRKGNIVENSVACLCDEINKNDKAFGLESKRAWFSADGYKAPDKATVFETLNDLCDFCKE